MLHNRKHAVITGPKTGLYLSFQTRFTQKPLFTKDVGDEQVDYYDNNCHSADAEPEDREGELNVMLLTSI